MKQRCQPNRRNRVLEHPSVDGINVRTASLDDAAAIAEIYNQGIEDRVATYETRRRSAEDQQAWLQAIAGRYPAVVAQINGEIIARTLTTSSGALGVVPEVTPASVIFGFLGLVVAISSRRALMARVRLATAQRNSVR